MESDIDWHTARALYEWQAELGATEAILDAPINRFELDQSTKPAAKVSPKEPVKPIAEVSPSDVATQLAQQASDIAGLEQIVQSFDLCELRKGARKFVFAQGSPQARVMVIGDAPTRADEDAGHPFAGREGALFDKMFAAIGLGRDTGSDATALYLTNLFPWNPARKPTAIEVDMMLPFLLRHIELKSPDYIVVMGPLVCQALLKKSSMQSARGNWVELVGTPALTIFPPSFLLQDPNAKRAAWQDLLMLKSRLDA